MPSPDKVEPEKFKALLKEAAQLAQRNTRMKGYGHGIYQRIGTPDDLNVAPLKYGKDEKKWRRLGKITPKDSQPTNSDHASE